MKYLLKLLLYDASSYHAAKNLIGRSPADIEHADSFGTTALHAAATNGWLECEQLLIEWKASLILTDKYSRTAFWNACANSYAESAKFLIGAAYGQGYNNIAKMASADGRSPFSKACGR